MNSQFTILHHSRLIWSNTNYISDEEWRIESKNNDWLLHAFSRLIKARPTLDPMLAIVEYGPDVQATKRLAAKLGVSDYISWLPKLDRRELMWILSQVSVGVGEFYEVPRTIWGGTGWETLASGKPLLQGFNFNMGEFEKIFGTLPPPMLAVQSRDDIYHHLLDMVDHPEKRDEIGHAAKEWFNKHNGIGLAKQWLELLNVPHSDALVSSDKTNQTIQGKI